MVAAEHIRDVHGWTADAADGTPLDALHWADHYLGPVDHDHPAEGDG
jgi:hypothetical protein